MVSDTAFANSDLGIECPTKNSSSNYEMIFECYKKLDVNKSVLEKMFGDIRWISGTFNDAKLYNIKYQGSTGFATMEIPIPIPLVSSLISDIKFTQNNSNYQIDFLTGKLAGSEMSVSVTATDSFDGTPNMGSDVSLKFKLKKKMCLTWGVICASPNEVMYALDKGLTLLEPKAKLYQKNNPENILIPSDPKTSENPTASTTQNKSFVDQKTYDEIQTAPIVKKVAKEFESQPKKEYFPITTLPKNIQGSVKITIIADKSVYVYGANIILTTIVPYVNNQPIFLEFYNVDNELVLTKQVYPDSNGFSKESFEIGRKLPAKIHDIFTIFASYGDSKVSEKVYLSDFGVSVELDQKTYISTEKVYLTIIAPDFNRNSNVIDTIGDDEESSITISTNRGYITDYTLVEISEDAGIFAGEITLVADGSTGGASPTGGKLATYPEDKLQVWLSESHRDVIKIAKISAGIGSTTAITPQISENSPSITIQPTIPSWIKNNAEWWTSGLIGEEDFINAIEYMIKEKIISISVTDYGSTENVQNIPSWVKQSAGWWVDGIITDGEFVKGLEYLVKEGIIYVN
ncbi:MAG: hypothetical protein IIA83_02190 [Thaumarchaeota archaeon]|nr:hypothetical protein [Nitrososphaerota archaeon]